MIRFPEGFLWGAATSAYQIEGSTRADGAGPSIWDRFCHSPGRILDGQSGDVACDHYRRWPEDVALMRELGLQSYRFSIAWGRILPEGDGRVNPRGLDHYSRFVDALLEAGITPNVTLFHWDLPAALDDRGGWLNPDAPRWFEEYARILFGRLDDRVPMWSTLNEPWVVTDGGYLFGVNAPGHRNLFEAPIASHHLLLAHARAVRAYRELGRHRIGLVVNLEPKDSATQSAADLEATRRADAYMNRQYLDPVFLGRYPEEMRDVFGAAWPEFPAAELESIREPIDFLGINYYTRNVVQHDDALPPVRARAVRQNQSTYTETGWEVHAASLERVLTWVTERYGKVPLYVTENGAAFYDPPTAIDGQVEDPLRVDYYRQHLRAVHAAIEKGADVRGYYAWSLLDNFEWASGFTKRFGLIHMDYATQKRTIKRSGRFYRDVIRTHGGVLTPQQAEGVPV